MTIGIVVDAVNGMVLSIDELPGEDAEQLRVWLEPILEAVDADVVVSDDADAFKNVTDETGRSQQVCKSHVVRNTDALVGELSGMIGAGQDHSLEGIGITSQHALEDLASLKEMIHSRRPEDQSLLEEAGLNPPETWDDYLAIAAEFHGKDLNGDGDPDYGSCISKARAQQSYWFITDFVASLTQSQGTGQGTFFDPETMEPMVDNAAFRKAMELYKESGKYGPPDELNLNVGDTRSLFTSGRCALSMDWGDIGPLAIDPTTSTVQDKVGAVITPGSKEVLDWETGELVPCDETTCPYAINGVNHAPFAAYGGWSGGINAAADDLKKDAAYAFFSYMAQPAQANVDVTIGKTGFNPYRTSQFLNRQAWVEAGFSPEAASVYLGAIESSLASPNMVIDLRIPQNQRYQQVVLDQAVNQYLAGEIDLETAVKQIYDGWQEITDELGR